MPSITSIARQEGGGLQKRDPGRSFVLGERLLYVLLAGARLQDEAAEDPLAAALHNAMPDCELYWRNKLLRPLSEIFTVCLPPPALQVAASLLAWTADIL